MIVKNKFSTICIMFTVITIISSVFNLVTGNTIDTHLHLLARFVLCSLGIGSLFIFELLKNKSIYFVQIVHYFCSLGLVLIFVCSTQIVEPLSKNAYRDVFLNYTAVYIAFAIVCIIRGRKIAKKEQKIISNKQDM